MIDLRLRNTAALLALPCAVGMGSTESLAADRLSMDLSAGVTAARNPFLETGPRTSGQSAFAQITPQFVSTNEISTFDVRGDARLDQYIRRYSRDESYAVEADYSRKISGRMTIRAGSTLRSSRSSAQDILFNPTGSGIPTAGIPEPIKDLTAFGQRIRSTNITVRGGAGFMLGPQQRADIDVSLSQYRYGGGVGLFDYQTASQDTRYTRQLSERTSVFGRATFTEINYFGRQNGNGLIIRPALGISKQLTSTINFSLDGGASFSNVVQFDGSHAKITTFAFRGKLCSQRETAKVCLNADRSSQPTALGHIQTLTRVEFDYDHKLNENDRVLVTASFSRTSESSPNFVDKPASFVGALAEYSHRTSKRLTLFASSNFADIYETGVTRRANVQVRAGIRFHFGAT